MVLDYHSNLGHGDDLLLLGRERTALLDGNVYVVDDDREVRRRRDGTDDRNAGDPPEARQTYDRLIDGGASNSKALHLMAQVLRVEMNEMLTKSTPFDNARYAAGLAKLKSPES